MQGVFYTRQRMIRRIVSRITGMHIIMELFTVRTAITRVLLSCAHIRRQSRQKPLTGC